MFLLVFWHLKQLGFSLLITVMKNAICIESFWVTKKKLFFKKSTSLDAILKAVLNLQTINAGEGVEKREPSYTVGGNVN